MLRLLLCSFLPAPRSRVHLIPVSLCADPSSHSSLGNGRAVSACAILQGTLVRLFVNCQAPRWNPFQSLFDDTGSGFFLLILLSISEERRTTTCWELWLSNNPKKNLPQKNDRHKKETNLKKRERERKQANLGFFANLAFVFPPLPRQWRRMEVFVVHWNSSAKWLFLCSLFFCFFSLLTISLATDYVIFLIV